MQSCGQHCYLVRLSHNQLHAAEGKKILSSTGAANTARQWVGHAAECVEKGDGKSLGKYLERIERDLTRSRFLIDSAADKAWQTEMRTLATQLKSSPSSLNALEGRVVQVLQRASVVWTAEYITEFIGHHLGLDYVNSRTSVSNIDGNATTTLQSGSSMRIKFQSSIRAEGDERGLDHFKSIDLAQEDKTWKQLGLGNITTPATEHTEMGEPNPNETTKIETTTATDRPKSDEVHDGERIPIELPSDPNVRLVVLDSTGGHTPQRTSSEPELVIYADGRTVITDPFGKYPVVTRRLSEDNLRSFLEFVVNEHHFYEMSTESLQNLVETAKARGGVPEFKDLSTAIIRIGIQNKTYEVRCLTPDYFSSHFPEAEPLQHYEAIYNRLTTFITACREWADKQKR